MTIITGHDNKHFTWTYQIE